MNYTELQGLIPSEMPTASNEKWVIYDKARFATYKLMLADEVANGSQFPNSLSYRGRELCERLIRLAYESPEKWDDLVRIYFGGELPRGYWDTHNAMVRSVIRFADVHYAEAEEAIVSGRFGEYEQYRYQNPEASHADAMDFVRTAHFHEYTVTEAGDRNRILGTHNLTFTHTCECGHSYETRSVNNWSGD